MFSVHFLTTSNEIENYKYIKKFYSYLKDIFKEREGYGYYKYPVAGEDVKVIPDILLFDKYYGIVLIDIIDYNLDEIENVNDEDWEVNGERIDTPLLKLEDYEFNLYSKYNNHRTLRRKLKFVKKIVLPLISKNRFEEKFPEEDTSFYIFNDYLSISVEDIFEEKQSLKEDEAELFIAVSQGAGSMNQYKKGYSGEKVDNIGKAINLIKHKIKSLDLEQHAAAIQIPDGPQRIRGMAGTGKTIILTMKAAFLHARYPDKKILYTFHTQALYNQIRDLITMFYREDKTTDPNWDNLLIRHSWGSKQKEGVYTRACARNSIVPIRYSYNLIDPLDHIFSNLILHNLEEEYDFVLIDEAQDFPSSFYKAIYKLTKSPKRIIFAYDELQSLEHVESRDLIDLFGTDVSGNPIVDFSDGTYGNDIEMDYVLDVSYRNPIDILMLAHGLGLGLKNPNKKMQIIEKPEIWETI